MAYFLQGKGILGKNFLKRIILLFIINEENNIFSLLNNCYFEDTRTVEKKDKKINHKERGWSFVVCSTNQKWKKKVILRNCDREYY